MTTITIERAVIHRALSALEYHTQQTRPIHNTELVIEELKSALSAPEEGPSATSITLAAMILSDCGISTDYAPLHERVAARITKYADELLATWKRLAAPATAPELSQHDDLDKVATARYKVVKSKSTIWPCSVVAGDGEQELFSGSESTCKHVARKLTGAFLDGAFYSQSTATLQSATAPKHNPDCRTCQKFINPGDGCLTVVKCEIGSRYSPVSPIYLWETL